MNAISPLLNRDPRSEARATLDALPYPQREEAEVLMLVSLAERRARDLAFKCPGAVGDRMDDLAEGLAELGRE